MLPSITALVSPSLAQVLTLFTERPDHSGMLTVYALNLNDPAGDTETECATLDEALTHLRELVLNEMELGGDGGPGFERFGICIEK